MKEWFFSLRGALTLSVLTLLSQLWRGFLDAMFVLPNDFGEESTLQLATIIFTLLFAGWGWTIWLAWRGSRRGLLAAFVLNGLVLLAVPLGWLLFYCPGACRAEAGIFNLANSLNLVLGLMAGTSLAIQLWASPQSSPELGR